MLYVIIKVIIIIFILIYKKLYEMEKMKNYDTINQMFFYEYQNFEKNYDDYKVFSEILFKNIIQFFFLLINLSIFYLNL